MNKQAGMREASHYGVVPFFNYNYILLLKYMKRGCRTK